MAPNLAKAGLDFSALAFLEYARGERRDNSHVSKLTHVPYRSTLNGNEMSAVLWTSNCALSS